jgi:hypothetical protein
VRKKISDDMKIKTRFYLGSETGDPLIHIYTRNDAELINKNKIIPSGSFSVENTINDFKYRITGGYYGFFTTGAENDTEIQKISSYYYSKQNKQFLASFQAGYNFDEKKHLEFEAGLISYYGWDIPPFIELFTLTCITIWQP